LVLARASSMAISPNGASCDSCASATSTIISGYSAPYSAGVATKASVTRFAHIVPGFLILFYLSFHVLVVFDRRAPEPWNFTNINAQAALAERNVDIREWWAASSSSQVRIRCRRCW
jgi:hypothetical protein